MTARQFHQWRQKRRLTQREAARILRVSIWSVRAYEAGRRPVSRPVAQRIIALAELARLAS